jgi:dTDP-4-amino-4,6-dideoxygalactose transaminase
MVTSGTAAVAAALAAVLDLHSGDETGEVILPNYTFVATASAAVDRGAQVTFVDIDPDTFTMDPASFEAAIVPGRTRAVMPVHILGHPADMARINAVANAHGIKVIEDAAQAHGAECDLGRTGALGEAAAFSFQSSKNLTCGEGGLVTTDSREIIDRVVAFMDVGRDPKGYRWDYPRLGWNYRPSEYLAAILNVRLDDLEEQIARRSRMAAVLDDRLGAIPGVKPPVKGRWCRRHAYHLYAVGLDPAAFGGRSRDEIVAAVNAEGVPCSAGYREPLSDSPAMREHLRRCPGSVRVMPCPNTRYACDHSLWFGQNMLLADERDMDDIVNAIAKVQRAFSACSTREHGND